MIIKSYEIKKNLKNNINIFLFYGQNNGLIEETINKDLKPIFSNNIYNYDETEILLDEGIFEENLLNKSFFENDKLIIINRVSDKILPLIKKISEVNVEDVKIILKSGNLEKKSKLRNFFEKEQKLIISPFYEDTHQSLLLLAQNILTKNEIKISTQNINFIVEKSKGIRINLKNELQKIIIYGKKKRTIEFEDLLKLTCSNQDYEISELIDQCLIKNKKKTILILNENNSLIEDNILILRSFLFKLKRLKKLKKEIEIKKDQDQVLSSYKPPIFWKDKDIIKQQLRIWSIDKIKLLIRKISNLELQAKKNSEISKKIINNFIIESLEISSN